MRWILTLLLRLLPALCLLAAPAMGQSAMSSGLFAQRGALFEAAPGGKPAVQGASLFAPPEAGGLFAALPGRLDAPLRQGGPVARGLRDLIARAEAGAAGYDAVQLGARVKPPAPPTRMTLAEIHAWIDATPGQPHAIGRYQFIPPTLRRSADRLDLPRDTRFSPAVQDRLADLLLGDAGLDRMLAGEMQLETFMLNLAKIWAGLPVPSGRSYYEGIAGNKAVLSYESYRAAMHRIMARHDG